MLEFLNKAFRAVALLSAIVVMLVLVVLSGCTKKGPQLGAESQPGDKLPAQEGEPFKIGVIPALNLGNTKIGMDKLAEHLSRELSVRVELKVFPDYNAVVEAMNYGQIDLAYLGPLTYVIANHQGGAQAVVTQLVKGQPFYYSYIIVHKDSPLKTVEDLVKNSKNVKFAFGDPNSTSGSLIPGIELKKHGVYRGPTDHDFKELKFTGSHDVTALAVQDRGVDAGAIDQAFFDVLKEKKKVDGEKFRVIWQSEKLFQYPWAVKKGTPSETAEKLRAAFVKITDKDILDAFGASGFTIAQDADYEAIRQAARADGRLK